MFGKIHPWRRLGQGFCVPRVFWLLFQFDSLLLVYSGFLLLLDSVLEDRMFLEICPFHSGCPISWHIVFIVISYNPLYFFGIGCNFYFISFLFLFFKDFIYLFLERGKGKEREKEGNISVRLPLGALSWGPGLQPRHVPLLGIDLATLWFIGLNSIYWATPARALFHLWFYLFGSSLFFYWYIWLKACQLCLSFQRTSSWTY